MMNTQPQSIEQELIKRYNERLEMVWKEPNPYIKPLWEAQELKQWISKLEKLVKN